MKVINKYIVSSIILLSLNSYVYGFVGGAHGGFHGGFRGGYSSYSRNSNPWNMRDLALEFFLILLFYSVIAIFLSLDNYIYKTKLGKKYKEYKQQRYIKKCRYAPLLSKQLYSSSDVLNATNSLKIKAMSDIKKLDSLAKNSHEQLVEKALKAFTRLQKAFSDRNHVLVAKACINPKYTNQLCNQIDKMIAMGVYNFIAETEFKECHLVKLYKSKLSHGFILRFVIKGQQLDEYTNKRYLANPGIFTPRKFNCLVDLVPYKKHFKIYYLDINQHPDDYVMTKKNQCASGEAGIRQKIYLKFL